MLQKHNVAFSSLVTKSGSSFLAKALVLKKFRLLKALNDSDVLEQGWYNTLRFWGLPPLILLTILDQKDSVKFLVDLGAEIDVVDTQFAANAFDWYSSINSILEASENNKMKFKRNTMSILINDIFSQTTGNFLQKKGLLPSRKGQSSIDLKKQLSKAAKIVIKNINLD
jgi:hypothetical protein